MWYYCRPPVCYNTAELIYVFGSPILSLLDTQNVHEIDLYVFLSELPFNMYKIINL